MNFFGRSAFVASFFGSMASLVACGGVETDTIKEKPALSAEDKDGLDRYDAVSSAAEADWTEVRVVESAHPYTNRANNTWSVNGSAGAREMRVVFERFELENNYDFLVLTNAAGDNTTRHTGTKTGQEVVVPGDRVDFRLTSDTSVTGWGFRARVYERRPCVCPAVFNPVCGADGTTYSNACAAACAGATVAQTGECGASVWTAVPNVVESAHPYTHNLSQTWSIGFAGASQMRIHFSRIETERNYDFVRILDGNGRMLHEYTGTSRDVTTPAIRAAQVTVQFVSDSSVNGWGFAIDRVDVMGGCQTNSDCGAGESCVQVQCTRAPCFNVCQAPNPGTGYQAVTLAALQANPTAFNERRIEVVAAPLYSTPVCTRIGCTASNPCCNRCQSGFTLGGDIALAGANGVAFGCDGNECTVASSCNPAFDTRDPGEYRFRGTFRVQAFGARQLTVDEFRATSCAPTGCSGQVCGNASVTTTCDVRPEYQCYRSATCEAQSNGLCAWTQTAALTQCLAGGGTTGARTFTSADTPLSIPDNNTTGITSSVQVPTVASGRTVRVSVAITHPYRGDLRVVLVSPTNRERVLSDRAGGSFDDLVLENVDVTSLVTGAATGTWRLRVTDGARSDTGALNQWSITVE